jgi:chromosomal replication initiation ATPase DnaA
MTTPKKKPEKSFREIVRDLRSRKFFDLATGIAREHHVSIGEMLGRSHHPAESFARHHLWSVLYERLFSLVAVGELIGRDHTSVLSGIRRYRESLVAATEPYPWTNPERTTTP